MFDKLQDRIVPVGFKNDDMPEDRAALFYCQLRAGKMMEDSPHDCDVKLTRATERIKSIYIARTKENLPR